MGRNAKAIAAISALLLLTCAVGATSATAAPPVVSMGSVSSVTYTSAHLTGTIDPQDNETFYSFEYATDPKAANWSGFAFEGAVPAGSGPTTVEADLSGLKPGTEYFVRLAGWNFLESQVNSKPVIAFETDPVAPPAVSISAPSQVTDSSAHFEGEIDPGGTDAAFDVNWRFECTPACPGLEGTVGADGSSHTVEADATGLKPGTAYSVSLVAQNAGAEASAGPEGFTTDTRAPAVLSTSAAPLNTEAALRGQVDPGGLVTSYRFEYGPTAAYGQSTATKTIPAGGDPVPVKADVAGLAPGSGYHFRLVVANADGTDQSSDRTFSTYAIEAPQGNCPNEAVRIQQGATYLPDCRAYEQVSPPRKNGTDATPWVLRTSADGHGISWFSLGAYANARGVNAEVTYAARRRSDGWHTDAFVASKEASPKVAPGAFALYGGQMFTGDLSSMIFVTGGNFSPEDQDQSGSLELTASDIYTVDPFGNVTFVSHGEGVTANGPEGVSLAGASENGSSIFFLSREPMVAGVPNDGLRRLYRWHNGVVEVIDKGPDGIPFPTGSALGNSTSVAFIGGHNTGVAADSHAVSEDGSAFLYASAFQPPAGTLTELFGLFLHEDGVGDLEVSASQRTGFEGQPASRAVLVATTPNLQEIYFWSPDQLTDDSPSGGGDYVFDRGTRELAFSNPDSGPEETVGAKSGVVRVSPEGRYVYFTSVQALAPDATAGARNLYVRHGGSTKFIATLTEGDAGVTASALGENAYPERTESGVSENGERLAFVSQASLAGYDVAGRRSVYVYDATSGSLTCASCPPSGATPDGEATFAVESEGFRGDTPRAMSADGEIVAFTSTAQLLPADTNHKADVYEYLHGRLHLLSSGRSPYPSEFAGMSPDGTDIYLFSRQALAPTDVDTGQNDVYDVRRGGGFLVSNESAPCSGEGCQGIQAGFPSAERPGSTVVGSGKSKAKRRHHARHRKRPHRKSSRSRHGDHRTHLTSRGTK